MYHFLIAYVVKVKKIAIILFKLGFPPLDNDI